MFVLLLGCHAAVPPSARRDLRLAAPVTFQGSTARNPGAEFAEAVHQLTQVQKVDGLILDFRFNVGGFVNGPLTGLAALLEHPSVTIGMDERMPAAEHLKMKSIFPPGAFRIDFDSLAHRDNASYAGPIAVLVGPGAISAGDLGTVWASFHPHARLFGKSTAMA